jgi:hypothetical protein
MRRDFSWCQSLIQVCSGTIFVEKHIKNPILKRTEKVLYCAGAIGAGEAV